jgi:hypothetical protein
MVVPRPSNEAFGLAPSSCRARLDRPAAELSRSDNLGNAFQRDRGGGGEGPGRDVMAGVEVPAARVGGRHPHRGSGWSYGGFDRLAHPLSRPGAPR